MSRSTAMILAMAFVALSRLHPAAQTQPPAASGTPKMPVNVHVLKGLTLKEVRAEMDIVAASLGVKCENCHIKGNFPDDSKPDKPIARKMLAMTKDINTRFAEQFKDVDKSPSKLGKVTCFTCHNGAKEPKNVPPDIADSQ